MTSDILKLDRARIRDLFDLRRRGEGNAPLYEADPYPGFHRLRETGPVHAGTVHELLGVEMEGGFQGLPEPDRPHFSAFSFESCSEAFRDDGLFTSSPTEVRGDEGEGVGSSMLGMNGPRHRRYRGLVQPSFVPNQAKWWIEHWIETTVHALIDTFEDEGQAELNVDFDAAIPMLTITGSFGVGVEDALDIRAAISRGEAMQPGAGYETMYRILMPIIAARREKPEDDLISVLCQAELEDDEGVHRLSDPEIFSFSYLLLAAGSGTTWKQLGITLAALLTHPDTLDRVRQDRSLVRLAIEESLRWTSTDPTFARYTSRDADFFGVTVPAGSVMHMCLGAANRDPARWTDPDAYDIDRPVLPSLAFGTGPHICLGMHVARAEMSTAVNALLDRLPNLRLAPDADPPRIIGMYERGPDQLPVVWD
jgi:cytochrome P450